MLNGTPMFEGCRLGVISLTGATHIAYPRPSTLPGGTERGHAFTVEAEAMEEAQTTKYL